MQTQESGWPIDLGLIVRKKSQLSNLLKKGLHDRFTLAAISLLLGHDEDKVIRVRTHLRFHLVIHIGTTATNNNRYHESNRRTFKSCFA